MSYLPCCGRLLAVAALERLSPFSSMGVLDTAEREMLLLALVSTGFPNFWEPWIFKGFSHIQNDDYYAMWSHNARCDISMQRCKPKFLDYNAESITGPPPTLCHL